MSQEEQIKLAVRELEVRFNYIQDALEENAELLRNISDKIDTRLSRVESNVSSLKGQLKLVGSLLAAIISTIVGLIFFRF
jgi:hypothetical protein